MTSNGLFQITGIGFARSPSCNFFKRLSVYYMGKALENKSSSPDRRSFLVVFQGKHFANFVLYAFSPSPKSFFSLTAFPYRPKRSKMPKKQQHLTLTSCRSWFARSILRDYFERGRLATTLLPGSIFSVWTSRRKN